MNDYLGMLQFACIFTLGSLAIGVLLYQGHGWWMERETRKSLKAVRQWKTQYYAEMARDAVRYAEDLFKEMDKHS